MKSEIAKQYHDRFPETPTLTLAKKIYAENKAVFKDVEDARYHVKYLRGQSGEKARRKRERTTGVKFEPLKYNYNPFKIPQSDNDTWDAFHLPQDDLLIISDVHLPYHDERALALALEFGIKNNFKSLLINGDLLDFYQLSRFDKDPRKRHFSGEVDMAREFLKECKSHFDHVYFKLGNHEERYEKYLLVKAPEFLDVADFEFKILLKCGELGVHVIEDKRIITYEHLNILHGHEFLGATSQAVNPARGLFLKTNESCLIGHLHKSSEHTESTLSGKMITTWSTGCLCDLHPEYARINKWNHGFATVKSVDGIYEVDSRRIYHNKVL